MKLSKRLWDAIGHRFAERTADEELMVWAKVGAQPKSKRHAFVDISLTNAEDAAVRRLLSDCDDSYFRFVREHERRCNREFAL